MGISAIDMSMAGSRLAGRVACVTGAAGGIGRETALLFARQGAKVVAADKNIAGAEETAKMAADQLGHADSMVSMQVDVASERQVESMVAYTESRFHKMDVLFNNAGIMHGDDGDAEHTEENIWDLTMDINVKGVFFGCKYGVPALRRAGGGSIINTASFVGCIGAATPQLAYTASKGAVLAMTKELSVVHARENIRLNALCPGPLNTELLQVFLDSDEKKQRRLVHVPMGRFGEAYEMANSVLFLASDESSFVTGSTFLVDGGITAAYVTAEDQVDPFGGPPNGNPLAAV